MRWLIGIVLAAALGWSGYWAVGRAGVQRAVATAVAEAEAKGWDVTFADASTVGFPSRFDTTLTDLRVASADGRVVYAAPFLQVLALSYRPNHVIVVPAREQSLSLDGRDWALVADDLRASLRVDPRPSLPLRDVVVASGPIRALTGDVVVEASELHASVAATNEPARYRLGARVPALRAGGLALGEMRLDGTATFDAPLDRTTARPRITALAIEELAVGAGAARVRLSGEVAPGLGGLAEGAVTLQAQDGPALVAALREAGVDVPGLVERGLMLLAAGDGRIEVPLRIEAGRVTLFGAAIGPEIRFYRQ